MANIIDIKRDKYQMFGKQNIVVAHCCRRWWLACRSDSLLLQQAVGGGGRCGANSALIRPAVRYKSAWTLKRAPASAGKARVGSPEAGATPLATRRPAGQSDQRALSSATLAARPMSLGCQIGPILFLLPGLRSFV